jgi:hypothetical protein
MRWVGDQAAEASTIQKTLLTARIMEGFWDRWIVHGVKRDDIVRIRSTFSDTDKWVRGWEQLALEKKAEAERLESEQRVGQAEYLYRVAALYYNLIQWIFPTRGVEKEKWFRESLQLFHHADAISPFQTSYHNLPVADHVCNGRITGPRAARGCVIIVNPLDSSKEELFTYERDFVRAGFVTVSFDGPGQGETYTFSSLKGSLERWSEFINNVIDYTASEYPNFPIYLFGTSSGASWAIYGSKHPSVAKTVAVSPSFHTETIKLPDYFVERMESVLEQKVFLPAIEMLPPTSHVCVVHGEKDVMVSHEDMVRLKNQLPLSIWMTYQEEGHCCNYKLSEIRQWSIKWFDER